MPISLDDVEFAEDYSDDVANILGAVYESTVAPTEVEAEQSFVGELPQDASGVELAETLATELPLSDDAQTSIAAITDNLAAASEVDEADPETELIDDGSETVSVTVSPSGEEITLDTETGEYVVQVSTTVSSLDTNDVETVELIETVLVTDPDTGAINSLEQLDTEDYIDAAEHDSYVEQPAAIEGDVATSATHVVTPLAAGVSSKNKKKIVSYALKYAISPNTKYRVMSADCTNFVSQAMKAGGWKTKTGWYRDSKNWWYNSLHQSWTWGGAANWYKFARTESKRTTKTTAAKLVPGDVVQVKFKGDKVINHTMVVTKKVGQTVYVSYHSRNTKNKKLSTFRKQAPGATYYYHKV